MSRVLIVSGRGDWSAGQVAERLEARGCAYSWLDPADFPQRVQVTARLGHSVLGRGWQGEVKTPDGTFCWEDISAVFYRRPRDFDMPSAMSGPERRFARAQARVGLGGVLASLPVKWINHPSALADGEYKPRQLSLAQTVGLRIPATIVTNAPEEVRRFAAEQGDIIVKSLAEPIVEQAHAFLSATGLTYGAFDFIVAAETEDYVFLECNAAGQWGWLAQECGLPIADAIADELIGGDR